METCRREIQWYFAVHMHVNVSYVHTIASYLNELAAARCRAIVRYEKPK